MVRIKEVKLRMFQSVHSSHGIFIAGPNQHIYVIINVLIFNVCNLSIGLAVLRDGSKAQTTVHLRSSGAFLNISFGLQ